MEMTNDRCLGSNRLPSQTVPSFQRDMLGCSLLAALNDETRNPDDLKLRAGQQLYVRKYWLIHDPNGKETVYER
jgi:hypothetical protein